MSCSGAPTTSVGQVMAIASSRRRTRRSGPTAAPRPRAPVAWKAAIRRAFVVLAAIPAAAALSSFMSACSGAGKVAGSDGGTDATASDGASASSDAGADTPTFSDAAGLDGAILDATVGDGASTDATDDLTAAEGAAAGACSDGNWCCATEAGPDTVFTCLLDGSTWCCLPTGQLLPNCPPVTLNGQSCDYDGAPCLTCSGEEGSGTCNCIAPQPDAARVWTCVGAGAFCSP